MAEDASTSPSEENKNKPAHSDKTKKTESLNPEQIFDTIPEGEKAMFQQFIRTFSLSSTTKSPIHDKITTEHITDILKYGDQEDQRDRVERHGERNYNYKIFVTTLIFIGVACGGFIWCQQYDLLKYFITALTGFGGGFGVGKLFNKK